MKHLRSALISLCLLCAVAAPVLTLAGCATTATSESTKYRTLAAVGAAAQAAMDGAATTLKAGKITVPQFQRIASFYDTKFQPAFRFAVTAAQADLGSVASQDLTSLLLQFTTLVAEVTSK